VFLDVRDSEGQKKKVLTIAHLAYLGAQGNKASETYAEWRARPTKKSAGHCNSLL